MKKRIPYLDFIRAVSVLAIVIFHFNCSVGAHNVYTNVTNVPIVFYQYKNGNLGQIGVSLFFILSGASLMYVNKTNFDIKQFIKKRWLSIFPLFYLAYFCVQVYYFWIYKSINPFGVLRDNWTIILTLIGMDGYLAPIISNFYFLGEWFLGCIILLYILFPLLRYLVIKVNAKIIIIFAVFMEIILVENYSLNFPLEYFVFARVVEFLFGMIIIYYNYQFSNKALFISIAALIAMNIIKLPFNQIYNTVLMGITLFTIFGYIGQHLYKENIYVSRLSKYSYPIFLIHHVVIEQVCSRFENLQYNIIPTYLVLFISLLFICLSAYTLLFIKNKISSELIRWSNECNK